MNEFINLQVRFFLTSVVWGAILLVIYDCLRIFRKVIKHGAILLGIEDIIYWTVSAVLIFRMMYQMNDGIIRGFSLLGILLGMILYKYSISEYVVKGISFVLIKIKQFLSKVVHIILKPLKYLAKKIKKLLLKLGKLVKKRIGLLAHFVQNKASCIWKALQRRIKRVRINESDQIQSEQNGSEKRRQSKKKNKDNKTAKLSRRKLARRARKAQQERIREVKSSS